MIIILIILILFLFVVKLNKEGFSGNSYFDPRVDKRPEWIKSLKMSNYDKLRKIQPLMLDNPRVKPVPYNNNFRLANKVYSSFGSFAHPFTGRSYR